MDNKKNSKTLSIVNQFETDSIESLILDKEVYDYAVSHGLFTISELLAKRQKLKPKYRNAFDKAINKYIELKDLFLENNNDVCYECDNGTFKPLDGSNSLKQYFTIDFKDDEITFFGHNTSIQSDIKFSIFDRVFDTFKITVCEKNKKHTLCLNGNNTSSRLSLGNKTILSFRKNENLCLKENIETAVVSPNDIFNLGKINFGICHPNIVYTNYYTDDLNDYDEVCKQIIIGNPYDTTVPHIVLRFNRYRSSILIMKDCYNNVALSSIQISQYSWDSWFFVEGRDERKFYLSFDFEQKNLSINDYLGKKEIFIKNCLTLTKISDDTIQFKALLGPYKPIPLQKKKKPTPQNKNNSAKSLAQLIGLENIKHEIEKFRAYVKKNKNNKEACFDCHMAFLGNPGTGKTEVAKLMAQILFEEGVLPTNKLVCKERASLVGEFVGQTAPKVKSAINEALGGVLFIDEAYSLFVSCADSRDFGKEAVSTLLTGMEENRGKLVVIFAGYNKEMQTLLSSNPGFRSRVRKKLYFNDYSNHELVKICSLFAKKDKYKLDNALKNELVKYFEYMKKYDNNFSNARTARNIIKSLEEIQAFRTVADIEDRLLTKQDLLTYYSENNVVFKKEVKKDYSSTLKNIPSNGPTNIKYTKEDIDIRTVSIEIKNENNVLTGEGTGTFVNNQGLIVTCAHVIKKAFNIYVNVKIKVATGQIISKTYTADVAKVDYQNDLAFVVINDIDFETPYFLLGSPTETPYPSEEIYMGGYPLGKSRFKDITINQGRVQSYNKDQLLTFNNQEKVDRIYVDMQGLPGNSGGAVISANSQSIIGIFAGASIQEGAIHHELKFAIPVKYLWELSKNVNEESK